jgi:hypothetical protein
VVKVLTQRRIVAALFVAAFLHAIVPDAYSINGGTLRVNPRNGWRAFEVITQSEPAGGTYLLPGTFDGLGAWLPDATTLRLQLNHETGDASVSEINLNLASFQTAIRNMISDGTTGGVTFVSSAQQAYDRWSNNGGTSWTTTSDATTTAFQRFCSSQSYKPNTFGAGRGFVDEIYVTGEEVAGGRLFALDSVNRDYYLLSGVTGSAPGGIGGMPSDSWENAALLDTGETNHVALLLSPDGGTQNMRLYIGQKGKDSTGAASSSFLARNGLAYGSHYYLNDTLPASGTSLDGTFDTTIAGALNSTKLEDVDTNANDPTQMVLGDQDSGVFTFDFNLNFGGGSFNALASSFSITKIHNHVSGTQNAIGDADNVDWTAATTLNGVAYPNGLIFVNEDNSNGETWMSTPSGGSPVLIADTASISEATETSGILDISSLVGYKPGSIVLVTNQGSIASITALINPNAALAGDFNGDGTVDAADYAMWRKGLGTPYSAGQYDIWSAQFGQSIGGGGGVGGAVPEPSVTTLILALMTICSLARSARRAC